MEGWLFTLNEFVTNDFRFQNSSFYTAQSESEEEKVTRTENDHSFIMSLV